MIFFGISFLAGILTILAPCILPLLPIVIGSSESNQKHTISKKSLVVISTLSFSVIIFTFLLKASTLLIDIPTSFWQNISGIIIFIVGLFMIFPNIWTNLNFIQKLNKASNKSLGQGYQKNNYTGDILMGLSLGPVFTTCSPTYLFIIATILPSSFLKGSFYLVGFVMGLAISLLLVAYFGQKVINIFIEKENLSKNLKKVFGIIIMIVGLGIMTGYDKKLETYILDSGYNATIDFEEDLIKRFE